MGWQVWGVIKFGPNLASFLQTSRMRIWYVVGVYVPPDDAPAVCRIEQVFEVDQKGMEVILLGDIFLLFFLFWSGFRDSLAC